MVAFVFISDAKISTEQVEICQSKLSSGNFLSLFLCRGKAMVTNTKPHQRKKEESERLRVERDQIKFIDLRFEIRQVVRLRKARRRQDAT